MDTPRSPESPPSHVDLHVVGAPPPLYSYFSYEVVSFFEPAVNGEDPAALTLATGALAAYRSSNDKYKKVPEHKYDFIPLSEARRTAAHQFGFYEKFVWHSEYGGPPAPAANRPGTSMHEYGYAIDVRFGTDGAKIKPALNAYGWVSDKLNEPWHFEARDAPSFPEVDAYIKSEKVQKISGRLASETFIILGKKKKYLDGRAVYERDLAILKQEGTELDRERSELERRRVELAKVANALRRDLGEIQSEQRLLAALRERIARMRYDRCPNGHDYEACEHEELKSAWLRDKMALESEYNVRSSSLIVRKKEYQDNFDAYNINLERYRVDVGEYKERYKSHSDKVDRFNKKYEEIISIISDLEDWEIRRPGLIQSVQSIINQGP